MFVIKLYNPETKNKIINRYIDPFINSKYNGNPDPRKDKSLRWQKISNFYFSTWREQQGQI
jgi:hypothetical protein